MLTTRPGEVIDKGPLISEIDFTPFELRVSTGRYYDPEWHEAERERMLLNL